MAVVTHTTALPDSSEKTDFYSLVDNAQVTGVVNADIASTAAIAGSKLATITTAGKVDGSAVTNLANVPSGAGRLPSANLPATIPVANIDTGTTANKIVKLDSSARIPAIDGSLVTNLTLTSVILASILDYGTSASASTSKSQSALRVCFGTLTVGGNSNSALSNLPFTNSSSYVIIAVFGSATDAIEAVVVTRSSGSAATIYNNDNLSQDIMWFAIGT